MTIVWLPLMAVVLGLGTLDATLAGRLSLGEMVLVVSGMTTMAFVCCLFLRAIHRSAGWLATVILKAR